MKLLDRYILTRFLAIFFNALFAFVVVFLVVDGVENLDNFIDAEVPRKAVLAYYLYTLPWFFSISLPMSTLLATFFSMGMLQKRNEITAMKASGLSVRRIGFILLIMGIIISTGSFYFDDIVVSAGMRNKAELQSEYLARQYRRKHKVIKQNIFLQESKNQNIAIDRFDYRKGRAHGVYLQEFKDGKLISRTDFRSLTWIDSLGLWNGKNFSHREFSTEDDAVIIATRGSDTTLALSLTPLDLTRLSVAPEEMRYGELDAFIDGLKRNGMDPTRWLVNLHFKVAFACTSFIMVLFGLPLSIGKPRSSLAVGAGMSIFVIFGYYVGIKLGQSLGIKGVLAPWLSVWLPNLIFISLGSVLLSKQRT